MEIVQLFKQYLFSQRNKPSNLTVKNYLSDIRKFLTWYETYYQTSFIPSALTPSVVKNYQAIVMGNTNAIRSNKRYISSLHKFAGFLTHSGAIKADPFEKTQPVTSNNDPWEIKQFTNHLVISKASKLTIKNYLIDIKQFLDWLETVTEVKNDTEKTRFEYIDYFSIEQYKDRLLADHQFSPISINRKLSSLRRYMRWLHQNNLLNQQPEINDIRKDINEEKPVIASIPEITEESPKVDSLLALKELRQLRQVPQPPRYSKFAPLRLAQKTTMALSKTIDMLIVIPTASSIEAIQYLLWKNSGKKIFEPVENIVKIASIPTPERIASKTAISILPPLSAMILSLIKPVTPQTKIISSKPYTIRNISKEFYAPLKISLSHLPLRKRIIHHLRYTRPLWYKKYHTYTIVHHIHVAIVILAISIATVSTLYLATDNRYSTQEQVLASQSNSPPRTLAFQGRLLDKTNNPITAANNLRFSLYNSETASDAAMLWQEVQEIIPDEDGYFKAILGKKATLDQRIFSDNQNLYVGITIGTDKELLPRQQIPTTSLASNAQSLQGLKAITKTKKTEDVILALDSTGNLTIGGTANHTFQTIGGQFTLSGQTLLLTTNQGSNGNIAIVPDGSGIIDLQKVIQNTSNNNNDAKVPGAIGIDDLLAVSTTSSTHSALTVNQNSTGDIISGQNNHVAKFKVDYAGNTFIGGSLNISGNTITTSNTSFGILNTSVTTLSIGNSATLMSIGGNTGITTINNSLSVKDTLTANGGIIIPAGKSIAVADLTPGAIPYINNLNQLASESQFSWSTAAKSLQVTGAICIRSTSNACAGANPGTIYASNATVQAADLAENYLSAQPLEPGDVVMPEGLDDNLAIVRTQQEYQPQVIGIVSTNPGFTLNSDAKPNKKYPYLYPLALQGRVPVKVSSINGPIKAGDSLAASSIPGVAMKATKQGHVIAKALENYTHTDTQAVHRIMAFVNVSYQSSQSIMNDEGNLAIATPSAIHQTPQDNTLVLGKELGSMYNFMQNIEAGFIEVTNVSTQSLKVASDNFILNGENIQDYITRVVKNVVPNEATQISSMPRNPQPDVALDLALPTPTASGSGNVTMNNDDTATPSASASPIYNSIASTSAMITPSPLPTIEPTELEPTPVPLLITPAPFFSPSNFVPASSAAELGLENIDTTTVTVAKSLDVMGRATFNDVGMTGTLSLGLMTLNGLTNEKGQSFASINTTSGPLKLQSQGYNGIDILNGKITIDTHGNLNSEGNASFAKDVTVHGALAANTIIPIPGKDLVVSLGKNKQSNRLAVTNTNGNNVLEVNQNGDVESSGSGKFANINIIRGAQADTSATETTAKGSAGKAVIKAKQTERTIITNYVTKDSLIYVTATSDTQDVIPYVARQKAYDQRIGTQGSFTIQIPKGVQKDITFNWWIVN